MTCLRVTGRLLPRPDIPSISLILCFTLGACTTESGEPQGNEAPEAQASTGVAEPPLRPTPGWSLDDAEIAFESEVEGDFELFLARGRDPSSWQQLTQSPGADRAAGWAPSGAWLAFESERAGGPGSGDFDVWGLGLVGPSTDEPHPWTAPVRIATGAAAGDAPAVSPDGDRVAFYSRRSAESVPDGTAGHLWLATLPARSGTPSGTGYGTEGELTRVTRDPIPTGDAAAWHPEGRDLFISRGQGGAGPRALVMISMDGTRERTLVSDGRVNRDPRPSPDGEFLAWTAQGAESTEVMVARIDGSGARSLAAGAYRVTGWTPDQAWIVADRRSGGRVDVYLVPVSGDGGPEPLFRDAPPTGEAAFRPAGAQDIPNPGSAAADSSDILGVSPGPSGIAEPGSAQR